MEDYKKFLKSKKVVELKSIARSYIKSIKFTYTRAKKMDLVNHLLKHTMMEDGEIKVIDSVVPVPVLIRGKDEDSVRKMIEEGALELRDKERIRNLLYGQKGTFSGRIFRLQNEIDEYVKDDKDNVKKIHKEHIKEKKKLIEDTKKELKIVDSLIADYKKKYEAKKK